MTTPLGYVVLPKVLQLQLFIPGSFAIVNDNSYQDGRDNAYWD